MPNDEPNITVDAGDGFSAAGFFNDSVTGSEPSFFGNDNRSIDSNGESPSQPADADFQSGEAGQQQTGEQGAQAGNNSNSGQGDQNPDKNRFEYWQSRADRIQNEYEQFKSSIESQNPILRFINEDPQVAQKVYGVIQNHLNGDSGDPSAAKGNVSAPGNSAINRPERPQRPAKPENYDPLEASSDTASESFKYRQNLEQYYEDLAQYNEDIVGYNERIQQQQRQQEQQSRQMQQQAREAYNEAVYRHNMNPNDAAKFVQWANQPNYSLGDLIQLYKITSQGKQTVTNANVQNINDRNQRLNTPVPPNANGQTNADSNSPYEGMSEKQADGAMFTDAIANSIMGQ